MSALQDRNSNAQATSNPAAEKQMASGTENRPEEAGQHKLVLDHKDAMQGGTYVSPSDAILSPASEKLAGFKQRQINKQQNGKKSTSRLLFGRTPSGSSGGIDDALAGNDKSN